MNEQTIVCIFLGAFYLRHMCAGIISKKTVKCNLGGIRMFWKKNLESFVNEVIESHARKTIFMIKGIKFLINIDIPLDNLFSYSFQDYLEEKVEQSDVVKKIYENLSREKNYICKFDDLIYMTEKKLVGMIEALGYKIVIMDINIFNDIYYDGTLEDSTTDLKLKTFNKQKDNFTQKVYSHYTKQGDYFLSVYNDLNINFETYKFIKEVMNDFPETSSSSEEIISADGQKEMMIGILLNKVFNNVKNICFDFNTKVVPYYTKHFMSSLSHMSFEVSITKGSIQMDKDEEDGYLTILKRINPTFLFRDILIYKNPAVSNEVMKLSQSKIIHDIYDNILKAKKGVMYKDIFVTASTGSGKSVMFQIPAIKAAEELDLVTLVVTPLIGLMQDQVENIKRMTDKAVTINSEYTPHEKDEIKQKIAEGEASILYLSPETLLSNTDISNLIGERNIGLIVIDEAHTVATWGKSFRPDYWFLGEFLKTLRKYQEHPFVITTFTATATYGGEEDMIYDIMNSLYMTVKRPYIGKVIREDISFDISNEEVNKDYYAEKERIVKTNLVKLLDGNNKSLIYFPFKRLLHDMERELNKSHSEVIGSYFGGQDKKIKQEVLEGFRHGKKEMVLATKAFGMGIDIDDIEYVYHYAPTGNLADYIQEIGRVARKSDLNGVAVTNYYKNDFRYIKQLHGMSRIKDFEIIGVVKKLLKIYYKANKKNLLVAPEEFSHVFDVFSDEEIDGRLKTVLLILKRDFEQDPATNDYTIIFKPRSMFTKGLFLVKEEHEDFLKNIGWMKYMKRINSKEDLYKDDGSVTTTYMGDIFELDFKELWMENYRKLSFGHFKSKFFKNEFDDVNIEDIFIGKIMLTITAKKGDTLSVGLEKYNQFMESLEEVIDNFKSLNKHFTLNDFAEELKKQERDIIKTKKQAELISHSVLNMINNIEFRSSLTSQRFIRYNKATDKYEVKNNQYKQKLKRISASFYRTIKDSLHQEEKVVLVNSSSKNKIKRDPTLISAQILELIDVCEYDIKAGNNPEFFVRINSELPLKNIAENSYYKSETLKQVNHRHHSSIEIMQYFFTQLKTDEERWKMIEQYFLGESIEKLLVK